MNNKEIITVATDVAYLLLKYGGEVYRAEQCARYICNSYGIKSVEVFAIPTSLVITISSGDDFITKTKRVLANQIDLSKVEKLNALSRYICENQPAMAEIQEKLDAIKQIAPYGKVMRVFSYAVVAMSFSLLFGSTFTEGLISLFIGGLVGACLVLFEKLGTNSFLQVSICSFLISAIAFASEYFFSSVLKANAIIAGCLMILVPGLALVNCMRDFLANDFLAGTSKLSQALMTATASALGVAVVLLSIY